MEGIKLNLYYYHNIILLTMTLKNNSDRLSSTLSFHFSPSFTRGHLWNYLEFTKLVSSGEKRPNPFFIISISLWKIARLDHWKASHLYKDALLGWNLSSKVCSSSKSAPKTTIIFFIKNSYAQLLNHTKSYTKQFNISSRLSVYN